MEHFDEDIEQLILQKEYFELSGEEKESLVDFISNENEYAQFKMTLLMSSSIRSENIQPKAATKKSLLQILENSKPERKIWYNSLFIFLFPENKAPYAKPGVYMALGAIILTIFLAVPMDFGKVTEGKKGLAKEEKTKNAEDYSPAPIEESIVTESDKNLEEIPVNDGINSATVLEDADIAEQKDEMAFESLVEQGTFLKKDRAVLGSRKDQKEKESDITIDYSANVYSKKANAASNNPNGGGVSSDSIVSTGSASTREAERTKSTNYKSDDKEYISSDLKKESFKYEILNDNGLSQNKDLIDLLYTAE